MRAKPHRSAYSSEKNIPALYIYFLKKETKNTKKRKKKLQHKLRRFSSWDFSFLF